MMQALFPEILSTPKEQCGTRSTIKYGHACHISKEKANRPKYCKKKQTFMAEMKLT